MRWSWRIGSIAGIGIYIHATFPLLLIWVAFIQYQYAETLAAALGGVILILIVFGIVVLHELGHALTARRFEIGTRRITLLPIGGLAELERMPDEPRQELIIAAAGPAVNVVLAILVYLTTLLIGDQLPGNIDQLVGIGIPGNSLLLALIWINLSLAIFNLIPAFPTDGGRILRALLALRYGHARATSIAAGVGKAFALIFGIIGLAFNPVLILIALFIWVGATGEAQAAHLRAALQGIPIVELMITDLRTLAPEDPLRFAVDHILAGFQQDFPVLDGDELVGILTRTDLMRALASEGPGLPVGQAMRREFQSAESTELIGTVYPRFNPNQRSLPVLRGGQLLGVLTLENIAEYMMVRDALGTARVIAGTEVNESD